MLSKLFLKEPDYTKIALHLEREQYSSLLRHICEASVVNYEETLDALTEAIKNSWQDPTEVVKASFKSDLYKEYMGCVEEMKIRRQLSSVLKKELPPYTPREAATTILYLVNHRRRDYLLKWDSIDAFFNIALVVITSLGFIVILGTTLD